MCGTDARGGKGQERGGEGGVRINIVLPSISQKSPRRPKEALLRHMCRKTLFLGKPINTEIKVRVFGKQSDKVALGRFFVRWDVC